MLFRRYKLSYFSFFVCCLKSFFSLNFDFDLFKKKWRKICFVGLPVISLRICSSTSITRRTKLLIISFDVYCIGRAFHFLFAIPSWELDKQYKGIDKQSYKHFNVILNYIIFSLFCVNSYGLLSCFVRTKLQILKTKNRLHECSL